MPSTFYIDYENGNDANAGDSFAAGHPWKTITLGATAARIAPGDIIKIAKSPAPTALAGTTATWTNLSKTVTLTTAETANVEMCEADWTAVNATSSAKIGTDWKEGTYALKMVEDATPTNDEVQCYYDLYTHDTTVHDLSGYQKISFWIKNEVAITDNQLEINLCSNANGTGDVDTFAIPAIPSTGRWIPLTIARTGGGNLGNAIKSINISNGSNTTEYTASKYVYFDNIIACTTAGLNLQSLISKNALEQSSTASVNASEGWYGIQSINGVTVLLDNNTNTLANAGRGYSTTGTSPETVNTYKRETIKTDLIAGSTGAIQEVQDSGTIAGGNIQFQGGYDTGTDSQTGETFFDGLNGWGAGIVLTSKSLITLNRLNTVRYNYGISFTTSNFNTITTISNISNCLNYAFYFVSGNFNSINTLINVNNSGYGFYMGAGYGNTITTISNANNNLNWGINLGTAYLNRINTISNANNNTSYGVYFNNVQNNFIGFLSTSGNKTSGIFINTGINYISHATMAEGTKVSAGTDYVDSRVYITDYASDPLDNRIYTDNGNIISQVVTRHTASGYAWQLNPTNVKRNVNYPLTLSIAKIAVVANKAVTVKAWMKISNTTDILGCLKVRGGQLLGVASDVTVNASTADTDWHEVTLADFTPTEAGVIEVECWAWWVANTADESVYIDDMTITQAD